MNLLPAGVVFLMSPVFQFTANVFSVPVRFQLTKWAGAVMNAIRGDITVKGNMIICNGNEFLVDPACMGLNMMVTSLLLQLIIVAMYQRKYGLQLVWWQVAGLLVVSFALNIVSNLFRIICLVWFNILPGTNMHELAGIACLLLYVNTGCVANAACNKAYWQSASEPWSANTTLLLEERFFIHLALCSMICWAAYKVVLHDRAVADPTAATATVEGYKTERVTAEIVKLQSSVN